jgi:hypothetical protein
MASSALADIISLYRSTPGRRMYALRQTRGLLPQNDVLKTDIDTAMAHDKNVLEMMTRWQRVRSETDAWPREVIDLDREHDRLWGALSSACSAIATGFGPDSAEGTAANHILSTVFSAGVPALIHLPFIEQRERTDTWLGRLQGEMAKDVKTAGVEPIVTRIASVNTRFGALVDQRKSGSALAFSDVRDADASGELAFLQIVAVIVGREARNDVQRARLLAPILAQNDEIAELHRRNRKVPDVDPNTGEVRDPVPT